MIPKGYLNLKTRSENRLQRKLNGSKKNYTPK